MSANIRQMKPMFVKVLYVNYQILIRKGQTLLDTVQNNMLSNEVFFDKRGRHKNRPKKIKNNVWEHFDSFLSKIPKVESNHYNFNNSKLYLNLTNIFNEFKNLL